MSTARRKSVRRRSTLALEVIPPGYYTGEQVRQAVGLSPREMKHLVTSRLVLSERQSTNGYALYSDQQVKRLQARKEDGSLFLVDFDSTRGLASPLCDPNVGAYDKDDALRVFELIEKGLPIHHVAMQLKLHPRIVDQIRQDYDRLSGAMTIPRGFMDRINGLKRLSGRFPLRSPADLLEVLEIADGARVCTCCQKAPATSECGGCIYARAERDVKAALAAEAARVAEGKQAAQAARDAVPKEEVKRAPAKVA